MARLQNASFSQADGLLLTFRAPCLLQQADCLAVIAAQDAEAVRTMDRRRKTVVNERTLIIIRLLLVVTNERATLSSPRVIWLAF